MTQKCDTCRKPRTYIQHERFLGLNNKPAFHDERGRFWYEQTCPRCLLPDAAFVKLPIPARYCRLCKNRVTESHYFYCGTCVGKGKEYLGMEYSSGYDSEIDASQGNRCLSAYGHALIEKDRN